MDKQFWLVWNPQGHSPTVKHPMIYQAKAEAERLARDNPGQKFYVLSAVGMCEYQAVTWQRLDGEDIPF